MRDVRRSNEGKAGYEDLCRAEATIGVFGQAWWLDAACRAGGWDAVLVSDGGEIAAALPYEIHRRGPFTILTQPPFTPWLGPWIRRRSGSVEAVLRSEHRLMTELVGRLPEYDRFAQNWGYGVTNWLPFYWRGFQQTTRYSHVLPDISCEAAIWSGMRSNIRREIRKAEGRYGLRLRHDLDLDVLLTLNAMTYKRQGKRPPNAEILRRIDKACGARGCRKLIVAEDDRGRRHAGAYFVWDDESAYYLVGGMDPELRTSGAMSLVMWEGIRFARTVGRRFDFEGSMVESIARFFRSFGAEPVGYSHISKTPSPLLRTLMAGARRYA